MLRKLFFVSKNTSNLHLWNLLIACFSSPDHIITKISYSLGFIFHQLEIVQGGYCSVAFENCNTKTGIYFNPWFVLIFPQVARTPPEIHMKFEFNKNLLCFVGIPGRWAKLSRYA